MKNDNFAANQMVLALDQILNIGVIEQLAAQKARLHNREFDTSIARGILSAVGLGDMHEVEHLRDQIIKARFN